MPLRRRKGRSRKKKAAATATATGESVLGSQAIAVTDEDNVLQHYVMEVTPGIPGVPSALCGQIVEVGIVVALRYGYNGPEIGVPGSDFAVTYMMPSRRTSRSKTFASCIRR